VLGTFVAHIDGQPVAGLRSRKGRALLAYLTLAEDGPSSREGLQGLFWPEWPQGLAQSNLRKDVLRLRAALDAVVPGAGAAMVEARRSSVAMRQGTFETDVATFRRVAASVCAHDAPSGVCDPCLSAWEDAAALYRGDPLVELEVDYSPAYADWRTIYQEGLLDTMVDLCGRIAAAHEARGDGERALRYVGRQLFLSPFHESAHRRRVRLLTGMGRSDEAVRAHEQWLRRLQHDTGFEPAPATRAAAREAERASRGLSRPNRLAGPCFGRETELASLEEALLGESAHALSIVGLGGVGKSCLATALAQRPRVRNRFARIALVPLAGVTSARHGWRTAAETLDVEVGGVGDAGALLLEALGDVETLVLLDDADFAEAGAMVTQLVAVPTVRVVVTSRRPLVVRDERRLALAGLSCSPAEGSDDAPAVALFEAAAQRASLGFRLDDRSRAVVAALCHAVDGLPLAIEAAASWVRMLDCDAIAQRVEHDVGLLVASRAEAPGSRGDLCSIVADALRPLDEGQRQLLAHLAVLDGGFRPADLLAEGVADAATMAALVDASLLTRGRCGDFRVHRLVRRFLLVVGGEQVGAELPVPSRG
jgi:DNA-binding SARP family transcriptional activator